MSEDYRSPKELQADRELEIAIARESKLVNTADTHVLISRECAQCSISELENANRVALGYAGPSEINERKKYIAELTEALK